MSYVKVTDAQTAYKAAIGQDLMRQFRDNQEDHESRIAQLLAQSQNAIVDDFFSVDYDEGYQYLVEGASPGTEFTTMIGGSGAHVFRLNTVNSAVTRTLKVRAEKLAFRLNQDMAAFLEARIKDVGAAAPSNMLIGFSDNPADPSDEGDLIGFLKGTTAGKWRFRVAKAGVSTQTDDIGNRATYQTLRIELLRSGGGATLQVRAYIDGAEISGSPFTTNIPDSTVMRLVNGYITPSSGTTDVQLDRWEMRWTAIPVQA